jgi:hypothetical protein
LFFELKTNNDWIFKIGQIRMDAYVVGIRTAEKIYLDKRQGLGIASVTDLSTIGDWGSSVLIVYSNHPALGICLRYFKHNHVIFETIEILTHNNYWNQNCALQKLEKQS